jgi:hypothetical protein
MTDLLAFLLCRCGHCKKLKPEYAKAAELVRGDDPPIALAKVSFSSVKPALKSPFYVHFQYVTSSLL